MSRREDGDKDDVKKGGGWDGGCEEKRRRREDGDEDDRRRGSGMEGWWRKGGEGKMGMRRM